MEPMDERTDDHTKSLGLGGALLDYVIVQSGGPDPIATQLAAATRERYGDLAMMNVEQDQGWFLQFLVGLTGARTVVEVGTFTGMSTLFLARGLPEGGRVICAELEGSFVELGRPFWERAGLAARIEVQLGPAADTLRSLAGRVEADLVFIDADKAGYRTYLELSLDLLSPGGLIVVDNVLWGGAVVDEQDRSGDTEAIRAFNESVRSDPSLVSVMVGVGDGLLLLRRG